MTYVYAPPGVAPVEVTLRGVMQRLKAEGKSPPDFGSIKDPDILRDRLAEVHVFPAAVVSTSSIDLETQEVTGEEIVRQPDGSWVKQPTLRTLSPAEIEVIRRKAQRNLERQMRADMREFADPVFMKFQAGEVTREDWLEARQIVRDWYADHD